jgi:nucleotide-binding universal stress UspA family protein
MKKILVATDFSACANNAMEYAMDLAKILNLEVCAVNVIGSMTGVNNNTYNALYIDDYRKSLKSALDAWARTYSSKEEYKDVQLTTALEVGSLGSTLANYIEANGIDMLVMGTMGNTSGVTGLFGSNSSMMVERTKIPTLIIPLESKFSSNPVITLATDFSTTLSAEDLNVLNELGPVLGVNKIDVLNVIEGPSWKTNAEGEEKLRKLIDKVPLEFNYTNESNTSEGIVNFAVTNKTDILCVVKRHHNIIYRLFTKSTVAAVANKAVKAVLVLHE